MWAAYHNDRTITTLEDVAHLTLQIRRCLNHACPPFRRPYRPEEEGRLALPKHEFGLDVIAWVGTLRYAQHQSLPEIYQALGDRRVAVAPRTVTNLLARYDELLALSLKDTARLQRLTVYRLPRSASSRQRWPLPRVLPLPSGDNKYFKEFVDLTVSVEKALAYFATHPETVFGLFGCYCEESGLELKQAA